MSTPQEYNVIGGLIGLGQNTLLEILSETTTIPDILQFLGIDKRTYALKDHNRFFSILESALSYNTFKRALIVKRLPQVASVIDPNRTDEDKTEVKTTIVDIRTLKTENPTVQSQRFKKVTLIYSNQRFDNNISFYAWAAIYINGLNQLKAELCIMPEHYSPTHVTKSQEWFKTIKLPPQEIRFVDVKSAGAFTLALTENGQLWSRGMNDDGNWDDGTEVWRLNPHFNAENGLIPSSIGPCKIRSFCFELHRAIIILENGAVFAYGQLQEFQGWPNIPENGFIELTDTAKMKPFFLDELRGSLSGAEGQFGIFGTFHVVKYFRRAKAFLTTQGIVLAQAYTEAEKKYRYSFTPIDPKFFSGEKIVHINHHIFDAYVTESGRVIITRGMYKEHKEFVTELTQPQKVLQLPFDVSELNTLILTKKTHFTALNEDGRIYSIKYEDGSVRDATDYVSELVNADGEGEGMKIKHFAHVAISYIFLFN
ncbi:MAG: hypothetical protein EZS28_000705 [Streblomastix strix]|uniref:Uncharacterized protein n=1 Tax=Streblomastix strix TaxID=222440 RepID=A0A5J4X999_9EUKA|nr:MAG: hypothetical protein EZS28_000705 [Streblomastix strix]